jgi:hypothetical protein
MSPLEPHQHRGLNEDDAIRHVVSRLARQFPGLSMAEIERAVHGHYGTFDDRPVRDFVPMLVERATREQLARERAAREQVARDG